jgi:hypothetical protein
VSETMSNIVHPHSRVQRCFMHTVEFPSLRYQSPVSTVPVLVVRASTRVHTLWVLSSMFSLSVKILDTRVSMTVQQLCIQIFGVWPISGVESPPESECRPGRLSPSHANDTPQY